MTFLFGYMNILIIIKWLTNYSGIEHLAPSIINTMINIPLKSGQINGQPFIGDASYNQNLSLGLLFVGLICVPLMLLPKPFILKSQHGIHQDDKNNKVDPEEMKTELEI
jgi:V-type H+-transporting ATPase subunit a